MDRYGGGVSLLEKCLFGFWAQNHLRFQVRRVKIAMVIQDTLVAFRVAALQITECDILFVKLDSRDQLEKLVLYQPPCFMIAFLPELFNSVVRLAVKFPWFMGGWGLLIADLLEAWEFMANMDLTQIIRGLTHSSDHMLELMSLILDFC